MARDRNISDGDWDPNNINAGWIEDINRQDEADRIARHSY